MLLLLHLLPFLARLTSMCWEASSSSESRCPVMLVMLEASPCTGGLVLEEEERRRSGGKGKEEEDKEEDEEWEAEE